MYSQYSQTYGIILLEHQVHFKIACNHTCHGLHLLLKDYFQHLLKLYVMSNMLFFQKTKWRNFLKNKMKPKYIVVLYYIMVLCLVC